MWVFGIALAVLLFWTAPKLRHRRYWAGIVFLLLLVLFAITLFIKGIAPLLRGGILTVVIGSCVAWWLLTTAVQREPLPYEASVIGSLADLVHTGEFSQARRRSTQKPLLVISVPARLEWSFLKAKAYIDQGDFKEGYTLYTQLLSLPLFQEERIKVEVRRICTLCALGDTLRATNVFERTEDWISDGYERYWLRALLTERSGRLEAARTNWLHALGQKTAGNARLAKGYNNLGRIEGILHNRTEALHYYSKAAALARQSQDRMTLHSVYPNLIDTLLVNGEHDRAASALEEYNALVDQGITEELVKLYNYHLAYARQTEDENLLVETLRHGQKTIVPRLSSPQRLVFEACELRIRYNHRIGWTEMLCTLEPRLGDYLDLDFPQQYWALKEIFGVLRTVAQRGQLDPFRKAFDRLVCYMKGIDETIRDYLVELPDYCVFERCSWEKQRAWLLRFRNELGSRQQYQDMLQQMVTHLDNVKDIHLQHGNPLEAIEADLNIADEAMAQITQTGDPETTAWLQPIIEQRIAEAVAAVKPFAGHPMTLEYNLRIARYALFLGNREMAKHHFEAFNDAGVSIYHYASWLQGYYRELEGAFISEHSPV